MGTLNFGFVSEALAGLCGDVFVAKFLPLVAVVDTGTAQQTRQIVLDLGVVLNQLCYRIKLCLAFLPPKNKNRSRKLPNRKSFVNHSLRKLTVTIYIFLRQKATKKRST